MKESLPKAVLFDLDNTLLAGVKDCWWRVCERFAPKLDGLSPDDLFHAIIRSEDLYWSHPDRHRQEPFNVQVGRRAWASSALSSLGFDLPQLAGEMAAAYSECRDEGLRLYADGIETLSRLREDGARLALVPNGDGQGQRAKIDRFGLGPLFDHIQIEGEFGVGKPDQRVYLNVLRQLDVRPQEAWMVGDNLEWEVAAPQRLGIFGIWFNPWTSGLPSESTVRPDRIIRALPELLISQSGQ